MKTRRWAVGALAGVALAFACGGSEGDGAAPPASSARPAAPAPKASTPPPAEAAHDEARAIFETRCATCHGVAGDGKGPGSQALNPPPRDLRDPAWQASVSDEHVHKIVLYGGAAVGRSPAMPGNPDLIAKPAVVEALVAHIRSLERE